MPWICARVCSGTAWADSLNFSGYVLFCGKSLSECEHIFGIMITVLKISQNNDNRGCHLEFYFHWGIGNWFQCLLVYPGLNLSSSSGSVSGFGSGSGFRIPAFPYAPPHLFSNTPVSYGRRKKTANLVWQASQYLCLKKNICQTSPSFLKTDLFVKDKNAVLLSEDYDKTRK